MSRRITIVAAAAAALLIPAVVLPGAATATVAASRASAPSPFPPTDKAVARYDLTTKDLRQIDKANDWSERKKAVNARACRSGTNFGLVTEIGTGGYQITDARWAGFGGRQFSARASQAPRFAQKLVAWRMFKKTEWSHLSCPTADWMAVTHQKARGTRLKNMLIPGTHDSGAYDIKDTGRCAPQVVAGAGAVFEAAAEENPCGAAALAKAQDQNLGQQLRGGVRYLDLRLGVPADKIITKPKPAAKNPMSVPLVLQHNYVSVSLKKGLRQILRFAAGHPAEQIILDFQHVDLVSDAAINDYYYEATRGVLKQYQPSAAVGTVCDSAWTKRTVGVKARGVGDVRIKTAWGADRNLIVLMDPAMPTDSCYYDRDKAISSPWPNTDVPATSKQANDEYLTERQERLDGTCTDADGINWCGLFVNQVQLTPSPGVYANCVFNKVGENCSLEALAALVNNDVAGYMSSWTNKGEPTNIEIVDYYEQASPSIVDRLIRLNWSRTGQSRQ